MLLHDTQGRLLYESTGLGVAVGGRWVGLGVKVKGTDVGDCSKDDENMLKIIDKPTMPNNTMRPALDALGGFFISCLVKDIYKPLPR